MTRKQRKDSARELSPKQNKSMSFVITLISASVIFIFVGYLMGQYALQLFGSGTDSDRDYTQSQSLEDTISQQLSDIPLPNSHTGEPFSEANDEQQEPVTQGLGLYRVQAGVFSQLSNAQSLVTALRDAGFEAMITNGPPYRVQTGAFSQRENAEEYVRQLQEEGFEATVFNP